LAGGFEITPRGIIEVKGKGALETYFLTASAPTPTGPGD